MAPVNPYGAAKAFATQISRIFRDKYGLFIANGIFYNHESPRRGENFVTRKICHAAVAIKRGQLSELRLGDTSAQRDWGEARDYVRGMWLTLQHPVPDDFVFATGTLHTVQDVIEHAFAVVGLDWQPYLRRDERLFRSQEPLAVVGNPAKAERVLGWKRETDFAGLIRQMVEAELVQMA